MKYNIFLLCLCFVLFASALTSAQAATLKAQSIISGNVITLGDLFNGLDHSADHVLGAAPRPGQDMILDARTLMRVAKALDVEWRPGSTADRLVVERSATLVTEDIIAERVREVLNTKGVNGPYNIQFVSGAAEIILPADAIADAEIDKLRYDPARKWFEAEVYAPSKADPQAQIRISGKIENLISVPVLQDTMRLGSVINYDDIQMLEVPERSVNHDVLFSAQDLIGLTPRRMILAGKPIKQQDVEQPRIVGRGESVTMVYQTGGMRLTALGKALEHGSKGDIIRVVNRQTSRPIDAVVTGTQEVTVKF